MKRLLKIVLAIVAIGAAAVVTVLLLLLREHYTEVELPAPTGSFAVGRATDVWRDDTTVAEELASHGYVVVGFDAPGRTGVVVFPDGRIVERSPENNPETVSSEAERVDIATKLQTAWVRDVGFVVDRLERLNASDM